MACSPVSRWVLVVNYPIFSLIFADRPTRSLDRARALRLPFGNVTQIHDLTAVEQAASVRDRELSPTEVLDHYLERIDRLGPQVGAFFTVTADLAREQARKAERMVTEAAEPSDLPPLLGVPVPVKDLNMAAGSG